MSAVTADSFAATIKLLYPVVQDILCNMCEQAKEEMKALPDSDIGSWKRAVTTADGLPGDALARITLSLSEITSLVLSCITSTSACVVVMT